MIELKPEHCLLATIHARMIRQVLAQKAKIPYSDFLLISISLRDIGAFVVKIVLSGISALTRLTLP